MCIHCQNEFRFLVFSVFDVFLLLFLLLIIVAHAFCWIFRACYMFQSRVCLFFIYLSKAGSVLQSHRCRNLFISILSSSISWFCFVFQFQLGVFNVKNTDNELHCMSATKTLILKYDVENKFVNRQHIRLFSSCSFLF